MQQLSTRKIRQSLVFMLLLLSPLLPAQACRDSLKKELREGDFFAARDRFNRCSAELSPGERSYFSAQLDHLFNKPEASDRAIVNYCGLPDKVDSLAAELLQVMIVNAIRLGDYRKADSVCSVLVTAYSKVLDAAGKEDIANTQSICSHLTAIAPQAIERRGEVRIGWNRDKAGLIRIPVQANGKTGQYIFDSGANFSTVSASEAKRMGFRLLGGSISVNSSSKSAVAAQLAVADTLRIGSALFRNVIFLVFPDKDLKFLGGLYKIKGIIGLPVIAAFGEVQLHRDGEIVMPEKATETAVRNFGLHAFSPFVQMEVMNRKDTYLFDSGAAATFFGSRFYKLHKAAVDSAGKPESVRMGGAGGVVKTEVIYISGTHYTAGEKSGVLKKSQVMCKAMPGNDTDWYTGIVGQDIIRQHEVVILNFDKMFFLLR